MTAEEKELTRNVVVDPGQLLGTLVTPLQELRKLSIRRLKLRVGLLQQFLVLGDLEVEALALFSKILARFL